MMRRLQASALTLVLAGLAGIAVAGTILPWERRVFGSTTQGIGTELGYVVFVSMLIVGAFLIARLIKYDEPHAVELPMLEVASVALLTMLVFYQTEIGRPDRTLSDAYHVVNVGRGFFVTLVALVAIEFMVAAHLLGVFAWLWTDTRHADADP